MAAPTLTFDFYKKVFHGAMDEGGFTAALIPATAELTAITGSDIPKAHESNWLYALCALIDFKQEATQGVKSERIGTTAVTYTDAKAGATAYDIVSVYLQGTGLLWQGV